MLPLFWIILLRLVATTVQVSVTLHNEYDPDYIVSLTCPDLLPGHCCTAPSRVFRAYTAHVVAFLDLNAWDIAAIWRRDQSTVGPGNLARKSGCADEVWRSKVGPGAWKWEMWEEPLRIDFLTPATGASYIEVPRRFPVDGKTSSWLSAEGVLGLVWGDGEWFTTPSASNFLGYGSGVSPKSRLRRNIRSERRGRVYARSPPGWTYPTVIEVNGTKYSDNGARDLVYRDGAGNTLNLTQLDDKIENRSR